MSQPNTDPREAVTVKLSFSQFRCRCGVVLETVAPAEQFWAVWEPGQDGDEGFWLVENTWLGPVVYSRTLDGLILELSEWVHDSWTSYAADPDQRMTEDAREFGAELRRRLRPPVTKVSAPTLLTSPA